MAENQNTNQNQPQAQSAPTPENPSSSNQAPQTSASTPNSETTPTPQNPSKEQLQQVIRENQRSIQQELVETVRYPAMKLVIRFAKFMAIFFAVLFFILAIIALFVNETWSGGFVNFAVLISLGIAFFVLTWCLGDFFQLWIDIEENTRKLVKIQEKQVKA